MAISRNPEGVVNGMFSETGDAALPAFYTEGFPETMSTPGSGVFPPRTAFNYLYKVLTALASDINTYGGAIPWINLANYAVGAFVIGSDGTIYKATVASGPANGGAADPTTSPAKWQVTIAGQNPASVTITGGSIKLLGEGALRLESSAGGAWQAISSPTIEGKFYFGCTGGRETLEAGVANSGPAFSIDDENKMTFEVGAYDTGTPPTVNNQLTNKLYVDNRTVPTGAGMSFWGTVASVPSGFIPWLDGTFGNASSGGTIRANADTQALYIQLWDASSDADCPVSGGRGSSALADFNANKTITTPRAGGCVLGIAGPGITSRSVETTTRVFAETFGEEKHALIDHENGPHTHPSTSQTATEPGDPSQGLQFGHNVVTESGKISVGSSGLGTPHNTIQPTTWVTWIVKL